jgi:ribosome-binding protein aMBF1 (putative translation factor)
MQDNEITTTKKVATFIKDKRLALGMSQREYAEHIFNDSRKKNWICRIENGKGVSLNTVERIFKAVKSGIEIVEY